MWSYFGWSIIRNFSEDPALSAEKLLSKNCSIHDKKSWNFWTPVNKIFHSIFTITKICVATRVPLSISYHLHFLRVPNVWSMLHRMLHHGSVGRVLGKECYFLFTCAFLTFFCCFSTKKLSFYYFNFFFWQSIKFPQQNINQLETGIGD